MTKNDAGALHVKEQNPRLQRPNATYLSVWLDGLLKEGLISQTNLQFQELDCFFMTLFRTSKQTIHFSQFKTLEMFSESARNEGGTRILNLYLGKHGTGKGRQTN